MKKLIVILVFVFIFTLSGCQSKIEKAFTNMEEVESYRMDMTMRDVPFFGTLSFVMKTDGDMMYTSDPLGEIGTYTKIVDGVEYEYIMQADGSYELSDTPIETDDELEDNMLDDLDYDDFEETEDNTWTLIEDKVYLDEEETEYMKDVVITLNDKGYIDTMVFTMVSNDMSIDVEVEFSDYNSTTVTLPE